MVSRIGLRSVAQFALEHDWLGSNPADAFRSCVGKKRVHTVPETGKLQVRNNCSVLKRIDRAHLEVFSVRCRFLTTQLVRSGNGSSCIKVNIIVIIVPVEQTKKTVQSVGGQRWRGRTHNMGFLRKKAAE